MENIKNNYRSLEAIEGEIKNVNLENFLDFDLNGRYGFVKC